MLQYSATNFVVNSNGFVFLIVRDITQRYMQPQSMTRKIKRGMKRARRLKNVFLVELAWYR